MKSEQRLKKLILSRRSFIMKKEDLVNLGLDENQISEIFKIRGLEIETNKANQSKLEEDLKSAEQAKLAAEKLVEDMKVEHISKDKLKEVETAKQALEDKIQEMTSAHQSELEDIKYTNVLEVTLKELGARDVNLVKSVLNNESLSFKDGKIEGLDDEVVKVKDTHSYLFNDNKGMPNFTTKHNGGGENVNAFAAAAEKYK